MPRLIKLSAGFLLLFTACGSPSASQTQGSGSTTTAPNASTAPASLAAKSTGSQVSASAGGAKPAASGQPKLTMASVNLNGAFAIPWIADATGAFANRGVSISMPFIEQVSAAFNALVVGEVDALEVSAGPVITANVNGHLDLVYVAAIMNHAQFSLLVSPAIKTSGDLKGKLLATDQPLSATDYGTRIALSKLGLTESDVQLRRIGSAPQIWAALSSKQVDAATLAPPFTFTAEKAGFHVLQDTYDAPYQNVGVVMRRSRIDALTPALIPMLLAIRGAIQAYNEQPEVAMKVISDRMKETDPEILKKTYEFYKTQAPWEPSLKPTLPGIQGMIDFLAGAAPEVRNTKPEQYVDLRVLNQLPRS